MHTNALLALAFSAGLLAACATAPSPALPDAGAAPGAATADPVVARYADDAAEDDIVCRQVQKTGSHLSVRGCVSRSELAKERR